MAQITSFPLCWPASWKRTPAVNRVPGRFSTVVEKPSGVTPSTNYRYTQRLSLADAVRRVLNEVERLGTTEEHIIISTNIQPRLDGLPRSGQAAPADPGVAVYWSTALNPKQKCMAIDRYTSVADNIAAVAATIDAMRAIERHGGAEILERAFLGFQALPAPMTGGRPWADVLQFDNERVTLEDAEAQYRLLAKKVHPDTEGSHDAMAELNAAIAEARTVLG